MSSRKDFLLFVRKTIHSTTVSLGWRTTAVAAWALALVLAAAPSWAAYTNVVYVGAGTVHLTYYFSSSFDPDQIRLQCVYPDGSIDILDSVEGSDVLEGEYQHLGLKPGQHRYEIWLRWDRPGQDPVEEQKDTAYANVDGDIRGELKWSDIVDGENPDFPNITVGAVDVPAGLTLSFSQVTVPNYLYIVGPDATMNDEHVLRLGTANAVSFSHCSFEDYLILIESDPTFTNCFFRSTYRSAKIQGGQPQFIDCDMRGEVEMTNRNSAQFTDNVFLDGVTYRNSTFASNTPWTDSGESPSLTGNSFLGKTALDYIAPAPPPSPIPIGANYYGDPSGWRPSDADDAFLKPRGARVYEHTAFEIAPVRTKGRARRDTSYPPEIWAHAMIHGQTSMPHDHSGYTRRGRPLLVSADVAVDDIEVEGARLYGKWNGHVIEATRPDASLHRDRRAGGGAREIREGMTTVNFIIAKVEQEYNDFELWADLGGLTSHQPGGQTQLTARQIRTSGPPGRDFHVLVWPVRIYLPGYNRTIPSGKALRERFMDLAPTWLPLKKKEIHCWTAQYLNYWAPWGVLTNLALINDLGAKLEIQRRAMNLIMSEPVDFIVVPLEKGALSGVLTGQSVDGVSLALRRGIIMIDESMPDAVFHEMGHGIGLYTGDEQYDLYPDFGLPNQACTSFVTPEKSPLKNMFGDAGRVTHHAASDADWRKPDYEWFDIMGNGLRTQWPTPATFRAFVDWVYANLGTRGVTALAVQAAPGNEAVAEDAMRLFIYGRVDTFGGDGQTTYSLRAGTVRAINVGDVSQSALSPETNGVERCVVRALHGSSVESYTVWMGPEALTLSLDVPADTYRLQVLNYGQTETLLDIGVQSVSSRPVAPASGSTLAGQTPVEWTAWTGAAPFFGESTVGAESAAASQPVQHLVMVSADGGANWMVSALQEEIDFALDSDAFASTNSVSVRVLSSTGLRSSLAQIDDLSVPDRPPVVIIDSPRDGAAGDTNTSWTLRALAYDPDDGPLANGIWTSSLDGDLGTSDSLENIRLSQGTHTLTYRVEDGGGLTGETAVTVHALAPGVIDLALSDDALWLTPADGSSGAATDPLSVGSTYTAALAFANGGVGTTVALALTLTPADGIATPVASATQYLPPFAPLTVGASFVVESAGELTLSGSVFPTEAPEANPADNGMTLSFSTTARARPSFLPMALDFGDIDRQGEEETAQIAIANTGDNSFTLEELSLENNTDGAFRIVSAPAAGQTVMPGEQVLATVAFMPVSAGPQTADLVASTDAPDFATLRATLYGRLTDYYDPAPVLRFLLGLTNTPDDLDRNGDNRVDIGDALIP